MKHSWTSSIILSFRFEWEIVVWMVEKSNVLMLLHDERDLDSMYSNISLEFFRYCFFVLWVDVHK